MGRDAFSRNTLLRKGLVLGGAAAAIGGVAPSALAARSKSALTVEVAIVGTTFVVAYAAGANPDTNDVRGSTFSMEGFLYKEGTIKGNSFNPGQVRPMGLVVIQGILLATAARSTPFYSGTMTFLFDNVRFSHLFASASVVAQGIFGSDDDTQSPLLAVTGGTGRYAGASGALTLGDLGLNATDLPGNNGAAPNYKAQFALS
jgi:hypothetical protein